MDADAYTQGDLQATVDALTLAAGDAGTLWSHWMGPAETALYFYGGDAALLRTRLEAAAPGLPLLERCRFVAVAAQD